MNNTQNNTEIAEDYLEVDNPIPGQNYVCMSMISPEKILKKKEVYFCKEFLKYYFNQLKDENDPTNLDPNKFTLDFAKKIDFDKMYENFIYTKEEKLNQEFTEQNNFQTVVRGIKIRGSYDTLKEAEVRAKRLQNNDQNHHVYVAQVGYWLPWDPNPDNIQNQEYSNEQLNTLMKNYTENKNQKDDLFAQETEYKKRKAREENKKKKDYILKTVEEDTESVNKINELREIANEKDRLFENNNPNSNSNPNPNIPLNTDLDNSNFADPWMQNKNNNEENYKVGEADNEITEEERKNNLDTIVKEIF